VASLLSVASTRARADDYCAIRGYFRPATGTVGYTSLLGGLMLPFCAAGAAAGDACASGAGTCVALGDDSTLLYCTPLPSARPLFLCNVMSCSCPTFGMTTSMLPLTLASGLCLCIDAPLSDLCSSDPSLDQVVQCLTPPGVVPGDGDLVTWTDGDCDGDGAANSCEGSGLACDGVPAPGCVADDDAGVVPPGDAGLPAGDAAPSTDAGAPADGSVTTPMDAGPGGLTPKPGASAAYLGGGGAQCSVTAREGSSRGALELPVLAVLGLAGVALATRARRRRRRAPHPSPS